MEGIESVPAILQVIEDDGEFVVRASKELGGKLAQGVLKSLTGARKVTYISDNDVKVFRAPKNAKPTPPVAEPQLHDVFDVQAEFEKTIEQPEPKKPKIIQDGSAPPSPELVEDYEAEIKRQQAEASALKNQERFNQQDAVQDPPPEEEQPTVRKRRERNLDVAGSPCGRCGGGGQIVGDSGFSGVCPVCQGQGQIKSWGRGRRSR